MKKTNPPDHIPKMHAEMEAAGIQELIDDIQSQLNEHPAKQEHTSLKTSMAPSIDTVTRQ